MKQKLILILSVFVVLTFIVSSAEAAKIVLKSGLFFNGEIKETTADSITIQPKFGKLTTYTLEQVVSIDGTPAADYLAQSTGEAPAPKEEAPLPIAEGPGLSKPSKLETAAEPTPKGEPIEILKVEPVQEVETPEEMPQEIAETEDVDINIEEEQAVLDEIPAEAEWPEASDAELGESIPTEEDEAAAEAETSVSNPEWNEWRAQTRDYYISIEKTVEDANVNFEDLRLQGISASNEEEIIAAIKDFRQLLQTQIANVQALTAPAELQEYHKALLDHLEFMDRSQEELLSGNVDGANKFLQLSRESYVHSKEKLRDVFNAKGAPDDVIEQMDMVLGEYRDALQAETE